MLGCVTAALLVAGAVCLPLPASLTPLIVDTPPPGVNFTDCSRDPDTKLCCIDTVQNRQQNEKF